MMAALATVLVACSKDAESIDNAVPAVKNNPDVATQQPVTFGAYVNRATTRAGAEGILTTNGTAAGQVSLEEKGFGVFAYYTDDDQYSPIYQPNFMYNTKVTKTGENWTYDPVRYWPNEFGTDASSEGIDRLTFFSYAPHVPVTATTGIVTDDATYGIVGLSRNGAVGNPFVKYYVSLDPAKQVDFCWGVSKTDDKPLLDLTKQKVNEKVEFVFNHALAALNVQVDAMIDELTPGNKTLGDETHIYVRSITFEGFVTKGAFNLNTSKPTWYDLAGANYIDGGSVTVFDGRTNGKEAQSESANEAPVGLNPIIVQSQPYSGTPTAGVTNTAVNLFNSDTAGSSLYVIPSGQPLMVTIVYDVETQNPKLSTKLSDGETPGTSIENKITKTIKLGDENLKLEAGKQYTVNLHLGMTSVKFDATVADWGTDSATNTSLPENFVSLGKVNLTSSGNPLTAVTVWKNQASLAAPDVSVIGTDENPLSGTTISWESDNTSVATVAGDGTVTLYNKSGTAKITATATKEGMDGSATASYTVYVNEVTGISITPATSYVSPTGKVTLTAAFTHTNLGTVSALPTVSWVSGSTDYVTISPATGNSVQATGVADGSSTITASIDATYVADGVSTSAQATVTCASTLNMAFRGYWVSPGILYRDANGDYGLTNERDGASFSPFESISYFGQQSSYDITQGQYTYYFNWFYLKGDEQLGAEGDNIKSDSSKLPEGWVMPSSSIWNTILLGEPKTPVYVNNKQLHGEAFIQGPQHDQWAGAYAFVRIDAGNSTYYNGILLFKDGSNISCNHLDTANNKVGTRASYEDNTLTMDDYNALVNDGCVFIPVTGYYSTLSGYGWREIEEGFFYCSDVDNWSKPYFMNFDSNITIGCAVNNEYNKMYRAVRLVKQAIGPMYP